MNRALRLFLAVADPSASFTRAARALRWCAIATAGCAAAGVALDAAEPAVTAAQWRELVEQNRRLWTVVEQQQRELAELRERVTVLAQPAGPSSVAAVAPAPSPPLREAPAPRDTAERNVIISGEAGVAFFAGENDNAYPNSEFRIDEAKIFVEARAARNIYLFSELDLTIREANDEYFHLGETYLEFEGLPAPWGDDSFTVRAGRLDIPFGAEYLRRGVMSNPLITHSLADIWGIDEGVEIFGDAGRFSYVLAVQNGGHRTLHDFDADKSVTARLGFTPARGWRVSASAMRTGDLDRANDGMSEAWFGNGFFRALGPAATTTTFSAELVQLDTAWRWRGGHVRGDAGRVWFDDNDTAADNRRRIDYWQIEGMHSLTADLYGAVRFSRIDTDRGYPLVGLSNFGKYFFNSPPTKDLWRLGLGLGYHFGSDVLLKVEYTLEQGELVNGAPRANADQFSAAAGVKF